jgi:hypothetical protein
MFGFMTASRSVSQGRAGFPWNSAISKKTSVSFSPEASIQKPALSKNSDIPELF